MEPNEELESAGLWIGRLERLLALVFVLRGEMTSVGLLVAAKSVFRFAKREGDGSRRESEYFLVGTLGSLCFAILTAILAKWLMQ